jgi:DNA-binding response OmpR family regulator
MQTPVPEAANLATRVARAKTRSALPKPHRNAAGQTPPGRTVAGKRILLVDDDPTVRDSLQDVLVAEGYAVIPAENGQQALDLAASSKVDLVLLDLNMPVKNGWDTFEEFTREHPLISIVIVTARPNQLFTAAGAGAAALLEKPMSIPTLLRTMETLLAEPPEQRLARRAGKQAEFHYNPATPRLADSGPPARKPIAQTRFPWDSRQSTEDTEGRIV